MNKQATQQIMLIDMGNSRIKWARLRDRKLEGRDAMPHIKKGLPAKMFKTWRDEPPPDQVILCNVCGPELQDMLCQWVRENWSLEIDVLSPRRQAFGVRNGYKETGRLGADRWGNLIAARQISRTPLCIIDCGTALTIDALDEKGNHCGGLIMPGLEMMVSALLNETRAICRESIERHSDAPNSLLAGDTSSAVHGGTRYAMIATIDRIHDDIRTALGEQCLGIITGGDASQILPLLGREYRHEPDLLFKGMALLAKRHKKDSSPEEPQQT